MVLHYLEVVSVNYLTYSWIIHEHPPKVKHFILKYFIRVLNRKKGVRVYGVTNALTHSSVTETVSVKPT